MQLLKAVKAKVLDDLLFKKEKIILYFLMNGLLKASYVIYILGKIIKYLQKLLFSLSSYMYFFEYFFNLLIEIGPQIHYFEVCCHLSFNSYFNRNSSELVFDNY